MHMYLCLVFGGMHVVCLLAFMQLVATSHVCVCASVCKCAMVGVRYLLTLLCMYCASVAIIARHWLVCHVIVCASGAPSVGPS